jgi:hypothetical protein
MNYRYQQIKLRHNVILSAAKKPSLAPVILNEVKDLSFYAGKILRFAQNDINSFLPDYSFRRHAPHNKNPGGAGAFRDRVSVCQAQRITRSLHPSRR